MYNYAKIFKVDYDQLVMEELPDFKRKPVTFAWLRALCVPFVLLYNKLLTYRLNDLYNLDHDSRVYSLRALLNDRFDHNDRRIFITDGFAFDRIYIFREDENKPLYLGSVPLYNPEDYADTGVDFIVNVPNAITLSAQDIIQMTALVNYYKLASKRFIIYRTI